MADKPDKLGNKGSAGTQMWQTNQASWVTKDQQGHRCGRQTRQIGKQRLSRVTDVADKPGKLGNRGSAGSHMWQTNQASWVTKTQ